MLCGPASRLSVDSFCEEKLREFLYCLTSIKFEEFRMFQFATWCLGYYVLVCDNLCTIPAMWFWHSPHSLHCVPCIHVMPRCTSVWEECTVQVVCFVSVFHGRPSMYAERVAAFSVH